MLYNCISSKEEKIDARVSINNGPTNRGWSAVWLYLVVLFITLKMCL